MIAIHRRIFDLQILHVGQAGPIYVVQEMSLALQSAESFFGGLTLIFAFLQKSVAYASKDAAHIRPFTEVITVETLPAAPEICSNILRTTGFSGFSLVNSRASSSVDLCTCPASFNWLDSALTARTSSSSFPLISSRPLSVSTL